MAKSKALIAAETKIAALESQAVALQAQLVLGRRLYAELKASMIVGTKKAETAQVSYWTDYAGRTFKKERIGNRATSRMVEPLQGHA